MKFVAGRLALFACTAWFCPNGLGIFAADDPFAAGVRPTEPLTPADEARSFHLPPGFKIELFAAEPDIQKPINMAFDNRGRLWVTGSVEYPYAAAADKPARDTVKILEDTDGDGRADKITTFADGLNIPIGIYPYRQGAIVFSIPNIYYLSDTNQDGIADRREVLYGPFGVDRDTHGLNNAFRRGFDGWIYACHGFNNHSHVSAADGSSVTMQSGNVYRFRLDGSHIEQFTWGQVNPFGMTFDALGQIYTADCHTKPVTLLLRGGYYESFGKPHDGLGFVPPVMRHDHGSTAIAGTACYLDKLFPAKFQGNMFSGNVMTSRVNRDSLQFAGSTVVAREEPDFLTTDDPWFRPVDLQIGPDGALYIADFYNRIIGHYEVRLDHPGRDRQRGRIWRVSCIGPETADRTKSVADLAQASVDQLIRHLSHVNLGVRMRATDELTDRVGPSAIEPLRLALKKPLSPEARVQALWALFRLQSLESNRLRDAIADRESLVRIHAVRMLAEMPQWDSLRSAAVAALADRDPFVARAAAEAIGLHPKVDGVRALLDLWHRTSPADVHLLHTLKIALRNTIQLPGVLAHLGGLSSEDRHVLAEVCLGTNCEGAAAFLLDYVGRHKLDAAQARSYLTHIVRHAAGDELARVAPMARALAASDLELQLQLLAAIRSGLRQRGLTENDEIRHWARALVDQVFREEHLVVSKWQSRDSAGRPAPAWKCELRNSADGADATAFLSSLSLGEAWTGTARSNRFVIPGKLRFFLCGHLGFPDKPAMSANAVRLRLAESNEIVAHAQPPRSDVAAEVIWDLRSHAGQSGYLEIADGLDLPAYAWLAVARFEPAVVTVPAFGADATERHYVHSAELAGDLGLREFEPRLCELARDAELSGALRAAAAQAIARFHADAVSIALARTAADPKTSPELVDQICRQLSDAEQMSAETAGEVMQQASLEVQTQLAQHLAGSRDGAELLLTLIERGRASTYLLQDRALAGKLAAAMPSSAADRIATLVARLPDRSQAIEQLVNQRRAQFAASQPSAERGYQVFKRHCVACHQVKGEGAVIGPQLDGIGTRGLDRILEDVLDPNRNIDQAFRTNLFALSDGRVLNGLFRREEGELMVIADQQGKEISFEKNLVDERQPSTLSLMPENIASQLPEAELFDLLAYLISQREQRAAQ